MKFKFPVTLLAALVTAACATSYRDAIPGVGSLGQMQVIMGEGWQIAPGSMTPYARSMSRTYTRDGLPMDRVTLIAGVNAGDAIFKKPDAALPTFRADMSSNEIEELVESSLQSLFPEGAATVSTSNQRPHGFAGLDGILFDTSIAVADGADSQGVIGTFVVEERLYLILYVAQVPEYYQQHLDEATAVIDSVTVKVPLTGRF